MGQNVQLVGERGETSINQLNSSVLNQSTDDSAAKCMVLYSVSGRATDRPCKRERRQTRCLFSCRSR